MTVNNLTKRNFPVRWTIRLLFAWIFISWGTAAWSQNFISGYVKEEESGEPLIGASVFISGTTIGASTNGAGFFVMKLPGSDTLILTDSRSIISIIWADLPPSSTPKR